MKTPLLIPLCFALLGLSVRAAAPALPVEARQFDFWVGDWEVFDAKHEKVGENTVLLLENGAGLLENWTGWPRPNGGSGKSLNAYNVGLGQWQQYWVGSGGGILELRGGLLRGAMVMTGRTIGPDKHETLQRITWTPRPDGSVQQLWEQSADAGRTWTVAFDGNYRRKPRARE